MKFNWGTGIAVFYLLFMVVLLTAVFKSRSYDHSLVVPNYYEEDLKYQEQYDKLANTLALDTPLEINQEESKVRISFPSGMDAITGEVWLFRPSNAKADIRLPIQLGSDNVMEISTKTMIQGRWKMKIDWQAGSQQFYKEQTIVL